MSTVNCPICNKKLKEINKSHLNKHNLTVKEYDELYPNNPRLSEEQRLKKNNFKCMTPEMSAKLKHGHTLEAYIEKYGYDLGNEKYKQKIINYSNSKNLESFIRKYGEVKGNENYQLYQKTQKKKMSLENYIEKYGENLGNEKYNEFKSKNKITNTRTYYQEKYGIDEGNKRFDEKSRKQALSIRRIPVEQLSEWELYKLEVNRETNKTIKENTINLTGRGRGKGNLHLDHKYSVSEGFKNNISPKLIGSLFNLELISCSENASKQEKCSITLEQLIKGAH